MDRESTETMIPSLNLKARVVVPLANLTSCPASLFPEAEAKLDRQYSAGCSVQCKRNMDEYLFHRETKAT